MTVIRKIPAAEPALLDGLCELLIDSVHDGASVGFLAPLSHDRARRYWEGVFASLGSGQALWVAEEGGEITGSVQLALCEKENGRHRGEMQKLFVHSGKRGAGIASMLINELEAFARASARTLLVLDTLQDSLAEPVYRHLGWQRAGAIPDYAGAPDGVLHPTVIYFKHI
jgi:acetyltransferase